MKFDRSIWYNEETACVEVIDQRYLPFKTNVMTIDHIDEMAFAIREMVVRGAPLIGVAAAYGFYLGVRDGITPDDCFERLYHTRPTAVNLKWALKQQLELLAQGPANPQLALLQQAHRIAEEDIAMCSAIGDHGMGILRMIHARKQETVHILTHCNAGWLATVQWGTATAPIYKAHLAGVPVHVWVDETRPRNQGARLTAWELGEAGIDYHVITDNAGGHLMQHGAVDVVITGSDRTTRTGDVCNKIGTYLKALAARDNQIPYYAALPVSTIDWEMRDGIQEIPIEQRASSEITHMNAANGNEVYSAQIMADETPVRNYAFDVTPARLVTGIITEKGICEASEAGLKTLYQDN